MGGTSAAELCRCLREFGLENDRLDAAVARLLGASPVEFKAMDHLHAEGELTPGQLADKLSLSSGAVTALIDRLERLGWVERAPHPSDRRSVVVRRRTGEDATAPKIYADFSAEVLKLAQSLSPSEREAFARFLRAAGESAAQRVTELRAD